MIRLAAEVSDSEKLNQLVEKGVHDLWKQVMEIRLQDKANEYGEDDVPTLTQAKGFKHRAGLKRHKRLKSWVELQTKQKRTPTIRSAPSQHSRDVESSSQMDCGTSSLAHPASVFSQTTGNQFSFTRLLMEPLNDE
ncbi:hypothetical protein SESBI_12875 [Sesbania bispinosa]|nr:hypothetical protein SESBI_12875 [Sesbania bispinosa]